jgi:hypothetical protein
MKEALKGRRPPHLSSSGRVWRTTKASELPPDRRTEVTQDSWLNDEELWTTLENVAGLDTPAHFPKIRR